MPIARTIKRSYTAVELGMHADNASAGFWYPLLSSGIYSMHKDAAPSASVINIPIPHILRPGYPTLEQLGWESKYDLNAQISIIEIFYKVSTADLSSAPTVALNKQTYPVGTGLVANSVIAQALTFAGVDAIGIANGAGSAGSHIARVTLTAPTVYADTESFVLTINMNESQNTDLDIFGIAVTAQ